MGRSVLLPACEIQCIGARTLFLAKDKLHRPNSFAQFHLFHSPSYKPFSNFGSEVNTISPLQCKADVVESRCPRKVSGVKKEVVRTLLIDNYDSYTYNIYQELAVINGVPPVVIRNDEWTWEAVRRHLYDEHAFDNIVLSPGPGSPTCASDVGICLRVLQECKDFPILGICLGHQALGYAHGAQIVHAPSPIHGRLSEIEHTGCELFRGIPSGRNSGFKVVRYHSLVIDSDSLPVELIPIAWASSRHTFSYLEAEESRQSSITSANWIDKHIHDLGAAIGDNGYTPHIKNSSEKDWSRLLMSVMHSTRPHYGVQFHPESIATCYGRQLLENFRNITVDYWSDSSLSDQKQISHSFHNAILPREQLAVQNVVTSKFADKTTRLHDVDRNLRLYWKKLDNFANQVGGSENIFCNLFGGQKTKDTFWLDSSHDDERRARFSFMGGVGGQLWKRLTYRISNKNVSSGQGGGVLSFEDAQGSTRSTFVKNGFLDFLEQELLSFDYQKEDFEGLPFDFVGGYVGFLGYGIKEECDMAPNVHISETPDACFFFVDQLVVIDHSNADVYILSLSDNDSTFGNERPESVQSERTWLNEIELKLLALKATKKDEMSLVTLSMPHYKEAFSMEKSRNEYMEDVARCMSYINDGESYELCLTMQMRKNIKKTDALGLYLHLRNKNPAPYAAWFYFSDEDLFICCSSPERFLRLDQEGVLEAKPIKGTIARGSSREEDERYKLKLQYSEKDQAENLMIVDLLRNDLGQVCEPGSVHVPRLMELETYTTVHTLVSTIRGKKRADVSPVGCVRSAFPGGSMTGAPKRRSVEILDSLERSSRGVYSGCIGFFSYNQTFDLNIVIRTIVIHKNEVSIGAGGAIVSLSKPEDEYEETMLKASALMKAVVDYESWLEDSNSEA